MTYLGRINVARENKITTEEKFSISEQGYTTGKLLDGTECQIPLNTRASKSFMSKSNYLHHKSFHSLPRFASKTQRIQAGKGKYVSVLFTFLIVDIHGHRCYVRQCSLYAYLILNSLYEMCLGGIALYFFICTELT